MKAAPLWRSTRLTLAIFAFLGFLNFYALRVNMSIAIVCMVNHSSQHASVGQNSSASFDLCRPDKDDNSSGQTGLEDGELNWDKETQGLIHGSIFWGYLVTNLAGGVLATKYGGKHVIGLSLLASALLTLLVPVVARSSVQGLMALRFFTGASQGFVSPAMQSLWSHWAPPLESSRLRSICFAGSQVGKVLTYPMTALLCEYGFDGGWPSLFYLQGIVGVVWFVGWCLTVYDSPSQHPRISARERDYIETSLAGMVSGRSQTKTPWLSILGSGPVWAIIIAHMCCNWGEYTFLTNIPTYMKEVLKFDIKQNGFLSALPYLGFWLLITVSSWLADLVRSKQLLSTTATRKLFNSVGKFVPALLLIAVSFVDCTQPYLAVSLLALGVSMTGFQYGGGLYMSAGDIAPMYAGVIYGISNTVATIPGFLSPLAIGLLTPDQTQEQWRQVFYIAAAIYVFGAIFFIVFSSGDLQTWAKQEMQEAASLELKVDLLDSEACGVAKQEMQEAASLELKVDLLDSEACGVGTDTPRDRRHIEPCDTDIRSIEASDRNTHDIDLTDTNTHNIDHSDTNTHDIDPSDTNTHDIDPSDTNTHNIDSSDTKTHIIDPSDTNTHDIDPSDTNAHNRDHSDTNTH